MTLRGLLQPAASSKFSVLGAPQRRVAANSPSAGLLSGRTLRRNPPRAPRLHYRTNLSELQWPAPSHDATGLSISTVHSCPIYWNGQTQASPPRVPPSTRRHECHPTSRSAFLPPTSLVIPARPDVKARKGCLASKAIRLGKMVPWPRLRAMYVSVYLRHGLV